MQLTPVCLWRILAAGFLTNSLLVQGSTHGNVSHFIKADLVRSTWGKDSVGMSSLGFTPFFALVAPILVLGSAHGNVSHLIKDGLVRTAGARTL